MATKSHGLDCRRHSISRVHPAAGTHARARMFFDLVQFRSLIFPALYCPTAFKSADDSEVFAFEMAGFGVAAVNENCGDIH